MADRYWVGGTGAWDATNTTNWSATSGGAGGASVPTAADRVFFDVNSAPSTSYVTIGSGYTPKCYSFNQSSTRAILYPINGNNLEVGDTSGGVGCGDFIFTGSSYIQVPFSQILIRGTTSGSAASFSYFTTNTSTFSPATSIYFVAGAVALTNDFTSPYTSFVIQNGASLDCSSRTVNNLDTFLAQSGSTVTLTSATMAATNWSVLSGASVNAATMTSLRVPRVGGQNASFGDQRTVASSYPNVTFANENNGPVTVSTSTFITINALTISGFGIVVTAGQTLKIGTSITTSNLMAPPYRAEMRSNSTGASQFTLSCPSGTQQLNGLVISNCNATGGATFTADYTSVNYYNNTGIQFANSRGLLAFFT